MILQRYLSGLFARTIPLSLTCSITFEQNYGGAEGDSANLAEAWRGGVEPPREAVGAPGRGDRRLHEPTGKVQVVGGVAYKVEGFFRACEEKPGGLTGGQSRGDRTSSEHAQPGYRQRCAGSGRSWAAPLVDRRASL